MIPELERESGSWIVVDSYGKAQCELFDRRDVEIVLKQYPMLRVLTALQYLSSLNA